MELTGRTRRGRGGVAAAWALAACGLVACDGPPPEADAGQVLDAAEARDATAPLDAGPIEASLLAEDQSLALTTVVSVTADCDGPCWVVIAEESGAVLGMSALPRGRHARVEVGLERRLTSGEALRAALHDDAGVAGVFEPGEDESLLEASFAVTIEPGTPDVRISVLNVGDHSYVFTAASSSAFPITADPSAENPPIALRRGWRYEVFNPANVSHPFELIHAGESADEVHLSQRDDGTLHTDASVAFEIVSPAFFRFTVSASLEAVVDAYRCLIHPHMRGEVSYVDAP